tara:strand:+ start:691 stop:1233 length:543 start_codon:yes stop_codon:yes gene_type:complete
MRIISGLHKNRRINFTKLKIRPTTDFAKESLFNVLQNHYNLDELVVLDLFAGSGNISYEFVSRGCKKIISIESNINCVNFIKKTKQKLNMLNLDIQLSNVYTYLKKSKMKYDIIFADPPYDYTKKDYQSIINLVFDRNLLMSSGILILEHSKNINFANNTRFFEQRKYGKVNFTLLKNDE